MSVKATPKQYAQALFEIAKEKDILEKISLELTLVQEKIAEDKKFKAFLLKPAQDITSKKSALKLIFKEVISESAYNFLFLIVKQNDLKNLNRVIYQFEKILREQENRQRVQIISAIPLTPEEQTSFSQKFGAHVSLETKVDPEVIGGLIVKINDRLIDASLQGKLNQLKNKLL